MFERYAPPASCAHAATARWWCMS